MRQNFAEGKMLYKKRVFQWISEKGLIWQEKNAENTGNSETNAISFLNFIQDPEAKK